MNIIAIDCGASFIKAAKFCDGKLVEQCVHHSPKVSDNYLYQSSNIQTLAHLVRQTIRNFSHGINDIHVAISNEMHGFLLADGNGELVTDYISWQNELGKIEINGCSSTKLLHDMPAAENLIKHTGMALRAGLPSSNLMYLSRSGFLDKLSYPLRFYTLGSYLVRYLSGIEPHEHPTNAAATGLYDLSNTNWNHEFIKNISPKDIIFPEIGTDPTSLCLDNKKYHIHVAIGDQQAALLGAGLEYERNLSFNLGTGAQVSLLSDTLEYSKRFQTRPYFNNKYLQTIPHIPSGRALNVFFRFTKNILEKLNTPVADEIIWTEIQNSAKSSHGNELGVDLSFFENAITDTDTGALSNINEKNLTFDNLFRSIIAQMAKNIQCKADELLACADLKYPEKLIFSGGISRRFSALRELIAARYPNAEQTVSADETLWGLHKFVAMNL